VRETGVGNALVGAYLTRIGLPLDAVIYITKAAPESMTWLTPEDARKVGIDLKVVEEPPAASATISAPTTTQVPDVNSSPPMTTYAPDPPASISPSFDCGKASHEDERAICSDPILSRADALIGTLYKNGKAQYPASPEETRNRLRLYNIYRGNCHSDVRCILSVQMMSLNIFSKSLPNWMTEYKARLAQAEIGSEWKPVLPMTVGQCINTTIVDISDRFGGPLSPYPNSDGFDSGSAANMASGGFVISYQKEPVLLHSKRGDRVRMCLVSIPKNCPPNDDRGRQYRIINLRTNESSIMSDSQHMCGGA
jgi:uncharacterized protein